ncbi:MAG: hypothetical protein ACREVL_13460 [Solimonas sp.]
MNLFCFASRNQENITRGVHAGMWAVSTVSFSAMRARVTKAERNLHPGARGLLYCNPLHSFTTPFVVESHADLETVVADIWPEPWRLPFKIRALGDLSRQLPAREAVERWPILQRRLAAIEGRGGVSAAMCFTGTTVFVPVPIEDKDWDLILSDLATHD